MRISGVQFRFLQDKIDKYGWRAKRAEKIGYFALNMRAREARPKKIGVFLLDFFENNKNHPIAKNLKTRNNKNHLIKKSQNLGFLGLKGGGSY